MRIIAFCLSCLGFLTLKAQNIVTYAGNGGQEVFYDVMQITNGHFLVTGYASDLDWVPSIVQKTELTFAGSIPNALGTNRYGFILELSEDMQTILQVVHFPQGTVEDIRFIKTNAQPYKETKDLFISCNTSDTKANDGGYLIAKLNANFVTAVPSELVWHYNVWAEGVVKENHPWDITSDGRTYFIVGQSHAYDWAALYRLNPDGQREVVENWRTHWTVAGPEWRGTPASTSPDALNYSGIILKIWGRCELRSWSQAEFDSYIPDENGGLKKGRWPADFLFNSPCDPDDVVTDSPGYNGYGPESCCPVWGGSSIVVDRRDDRLYWGLNMKTYHNPSASPDFEPAVIAMDTSGIMLWWSRLYHEITPTGDTTFSLPDQYIDGLAIDYTNDQLVVGARCHGNGVENFWEGDQIAANPVAQGFQNRFTGSSGNIHISWLGKLLLENGDLMHSTYMAEYPEGSNNYGTTLTDPNMAGWPNPNQGWPDVNTTRLARNAIKTSSNGDVCVLGTGRKTMTTANGYQQMVKPSSTGKSAWNQFVRVYNHDLHHPVYSSLVVGAWDTLTQVGGDNTTLYGLYKTQFGIIAVGRHKSTDLVVADGNPMPTTAVPNWGQSLPDNESAVLVYFKTDSLANPADSIYYVSEVSVFDPQPEPNWQVVPNPAQEKIDLYGLDLQVVAFRISDASGRVVKQGIWSGQAIDLSDLAPSLYWISIEQAGQTTVRAFEVVGR
jgi:hypothetical protein